MVTVMNTFVYVAQPDATASPEQLQVLLEAALQAWEADKEEEARLLLQQVVPLAEQRGFSSEWGRLRGERRHGAEGFGR